LRTVERSYLHLQPCLDGSGEGRFGYDADSFASITAALHAATLPPTHTDDRDVDTGDGGEPFTTPPERALARRRADGLLAICEHYLTADDSVNAGVDTGADAGVDGAAAGVVGAPGGLEQTVTGRGRPAPDPTARPPRRRWRAGRPRTRAVVVLDVAHLAADTATGRVARLLWQLPGSSAAATTPPSPPAAGTSP
jgi:hypothetical protein